jgi:transposase
MAFCTYIGNGKRFTNASQVANCIGLVPRIDISCNIQRYGGITKHGNAYLRSLLVMASWVLVRSRNGGALQKRYFYTTATQRKNKKKQ